MEKILAWDENDRCDSLDHRYVFLESLSEFRFVLGLTSITAHQRNAGYVTREGDWDGGVYNRLTLQLYDQILLVADWDGSGLYARHRPRL
jgi:hypothetical protein